MGSSRNSLRFGDEESSLELLPELQEVTYLLQVAIPVMRVSLLSPSKGMGSVRRLLLGNLNVYTT